MVWKILPKKSDDLIEQLLINRGITTKQEKEQFFNPNLKDFEKDLQIPGIIKALERIGNAIKKQELIVAFGDYDVDGICGAAVLYLALTSMGAKVLPYIPHREKEGYGLSKLGLEFARDEGAAVVITTDCGIVDFEEAEFAKDLGLDLIITDHHQPENDLRPGAFGIIHTTKMCGAAVAWSLFKDEKLLDLVALATISDMMPLIGVNRAIVKRGLEKLNKTERVGLLALLHEAGINEGEIGAYEIGHIIAPRLNASGRIEHAIDSLRLLCTKDSIKAKNLAKLLAERNVMRQQLTTQALDEAKLLINKENKKIHVLASENWIPGIIGLVAGRVCDETGCSTIAISIQGETAKGSARSPKGVNIVELLRKCSDILIGVGGHKAAAGFTIETKKIEEFRERLEKMMDDLEVSDEIVLEIEAGVEREKLTIPLVKKIETLEPFGVGNPRPILATKNMEIHDLRTVGQNKHLKGRIDGVDFIGFGMGDLINILTQGQMVDLAYTLDIDKFNGFEKLQLKVKDLRIS